MAKRALLVAITEYPSSIGKLEAATDEARRWRDVLEVTYGFDVKLLLDQDATRTGVTKYLRDYLFKDAKPDDELVLFYGGHGSRVTPSGGSKSQETLFLYPEETGARLRKSALFTAADFSAIVREENVPAGARIDVILDTCHAAAFGPLPPGVVDLFVPVEDDDPEGRRPLERFGQIRTPSSRSESLQSRSAVEWRQLCIIVAAAGEGESAKQLPLTPPRFVFSMLALEELEKYPRDSYRTLVENIKPKAAPYKQRPDLHGDLSREGFEFLSSTPTSVSPATGSSASGVSSVTPMVARTLTIRIAGICCFVSKAVPQDPFERRLVLPYDNIGSGADDTHIPFIEVRDDQMQNPDKHFMSEPYQHREYHKEYYGDHRHDHYLVDGTDPEEFYYRRFSLSGHTITIPNLDTSGTLTISSAFSNHVPGMKTITPDLFPYPRPEVFYATPQPGLISAFFDISYGTLDIGSLYEFTTLFITKQTHKVTEYQTPEFVTLLLPLLMPVGVPLTIQVQKGVIVHEILLSDTSDVITIGNEIEIDILGLESGDDITNHFELYYNLASPPPPPDRAEPVKILEPINSCTVVTWP